MADQVTNISTTVKEASGSSNVYRGDLHGSPSITVDELLDIAFLVTMMTSVLNTSYSI